MPVRAQERSFVSILLRQFPIALAAVFAVSVYRAWLGPGFLFGDDQFRFSDDLIATFFPWRSAWDGSVLFGASSAYSSPAYPLWSMLGLLAKAGVHFDLGERLIWFWPLLALLVASPYALAYRLTRSSWGAGLAAVLFSVNTWTIALVQRGHIGSLVAYALMPLVVSAFIGWLRRPAVWPSVVVAALFTAQIMYDLRYAYVTAIACALFAIAWVARRAPRRRRLALPGLLRGFAWVVASMLVFNLYWILPQLLTPVKLPADYDTLAYFFSASKYETIWHSIALFTPFYRYVQGTDPFVVSAVEPVFYAIPAVVALALIIARRNPYVASLAVAALIGIVIVSGPSSTFGPLVTFSFLHIPGMKLFRDISKFTSLVAFAYSIAIAVGYARFAALLRFTSGRSAARLAPLAAVAACLCWACLMRDAYNPARHANFAVTKLSADDIQIQSFLDSQPGFFRTLVFPTWRPELVATEEHPLVSADYLLQNAAQDGGVRELFPEYSPLLDRLASPVVPALLAEGGVRYVVVDADATHSLYRPFEYDVQRRESVDVFRAQPWLQPFARFGGYEIFRLKSPSPARAFFAQTPARFAGDLVNVDALAGSPWWTQEPAVVTSTDRHEVPLLRAPAWPLVAGGQTTASSDAWAFSRSTLVRLAATPAPDILGGRIALARAGEMRMWLRARPFEHDRVTIARDRFATTEELRKERVTDEPTLGRDTIAIFFDDPTLLSAPFPAAGATWFGATSPSATIDLVNPSTKSEVADVDIATASPDRYPRQVSTEIARVRSSDQLPGRKDQNETIDAHWIRLHNMLLAPGSNRVHLRLSSPPNNGPDLNRYAFLIRDDVSVRVIGRRPGAPPRQMTSEESITPSGLVVSLRHAPLGPGPLGPRPQTASASILRAAPLHLGLRPRVTIGYRLKTTAPVFELVFEVKRRSDQRVFAISRPLSWATTRVSVDVYALVQDALESDAANDPAAPPAEASEYDLAAVRLEAVAPNDFQGSSDMLTLYDATLDIPWSLTSLAKSQGSVVQPLDLRQASTSQTVSASARRLRLDLPAGDPTTDLVFPVSDRIGAHALTFWASAPDDAHIQIALQFLRLGRSVMAVMAAGRPELTDPDQPLPQDWVTDVGDPTGGGRPWKRYDINLDDVAAYRLPGAGAGFTLAGFGIHIQRPGNVNDGSKDNFEIVDALLVGAAGSNSTTRREAAPEVSFDGGPPIRSVRQTADPISARQTSVVAVVHLERGTHDFVALPGAYQTDGMIISKVAPVVQTTGSASGFRRVSPTEYTCTVTGAGGLLVVPIAYARGWRIAVEPRGPPPLTGIVLADTARFGRDFMADGAHVSVNDAFSGWVVPANLIPPDGATIDVVYEPEAASEASALLWLVGSVVLVWIARRRA